MPPERLCNGGHHPRLAERLQQGSSMTHTSSSGNPPNRGLLATVVAWYSWLVFRVCKAGLDAAEEWCVGLLRESLQISQRAINGASAWILSVFNRDYKTQLRGRWTTLQEQYSWWGRAETGRGSTLNAVLARKYDEGGTTEAGVAAEPPAEAAATAAARAAAPAGASAPHEGLRHRRQPASSSSQGQPQHATQPPSAPQGQPAGICEIEPADGPEQQAAPSHTQPHLQLHRQAQQGTAGAPSDASAQSQWWGARGAPAWLLDIADEATEAAAAAQEAATAAVQQAATSVSLAVEEAAATAASWARSMRAVFVEPPAGWGAHEAIKQTGLLEDVSLHGQLFISRVFDRLRWLLGKLTFSAVAQTPTAAAAASAARQQFSMHGSSGISSRAGQVPGAAPKESAGLFGRRRSPQHPAARAAGAGAGAAVGAAGLQGGSLGAGSRRLKLRSVTSVDLPSTRRASLEAEQSDDEQQRDHAADDSGCSETSSDAYDDAQEDGASSEASCSSTSSWTPQQQHAQAAAAAGRVPSAEVVAAPGELADLAGPPLTVRVPHSALHGGSSSSSSRAGHTRVSFAAASGEQGVAAVAALGKDPTPFAIPQVQQQHHADITALQQQGPHLQPALAATVSRRSGTGKAHKASSRGSSRGSSSRSRHKQRAPEGLGAVLPGRGSRRLQRSHSGPAVSALKEVSSAGQVIRMAGYPLEVHEVVTADGYLLRMERIPQPSSTDAVFMMHGVLDTSLTWVAGGITGSQAFAAWDRGFDVWLGTSRSNPPHEAADPARRGSAYWVYSHNEVGMHDMGAQIDHIHAVKMRELTALGRTGSSSLRASSTSESASARAARRPSGPRSSGTTAASSRCAIPEHADILEGVVDADVLVGIQHVRPASAQAAGALASPAGKPAAHAGTAAQAGLDSAQGPAEPGQAGSGPAAAAGVPVDSSSSSRSGRAAGGLDMSRAQSAAEIDQAAAAEAAAAFTRHRAALAAAGIGPGSGSMAAAAAVPDQQEQQLGQDGVQSPHAAQGVLLTPTAAAAAAAAARAASALGSAVATAAAAAGGIIGIAASAGATSATDASTDPARAPAESSLPEGAGHQQQQQQRQASSGPADGRSSSATITAKPAASSGLMERLLGGTVALGEDAAGCGCGSGSGPLGGPLQTQGSGLRHVSSAPDVSALAGEQAELSVGWDAGGYASTSKGCEQGEGEGGVAAGGRGGSSGGGSDSGGGSRHARRSSCPYFSAASPLLDDVVQQPDAGAAHAMNGMQEQPEQQQQEPGQPDEAGADQQPLQGASPFSLQQPAASPTPQQPQQQQQQQHQPQQQPVQQQSGHDTTAASLPAATAAAAAPRAASAEPRAVRSSDWGLEPRPYNLRVVCHSLGGLLLLIYCTQRARAGRPHHISRLILLSPAGFHPVIPSMFKPLVYVWRPLMLWTQLVWRQQGFPVQLPTFVARMLAFKLSIDSSKLPAVGDLLRSMARLLLGGDRSAWDRALLMPHYTAAGMPLLSSRQVLHFIQLYLTGRCQLFDYGSEAANVAAYQQRTPPVVSDAYHMLRDVPVHLVAGEHDGVIPASNVRYHYAAMSAAGMDVSYRQFDFGHMDFTFSAKEELGWYVMSLLMRA